VRRQRAQYEDADDLWAGNQGRRVISDAAAV
jgi:hypothetical protein